VPYLWLAGTVTGGWLMCRAADAATVQLGSGSDDASFLAGQACHGAALRAARAAAGRGLREAVAHGAESTWACTDQF
jgi:hypothetical protein